MIVPGTPNNDVLYGTDDPDQIAGEAGDDKLFAFAGDDTLDGGDGSDLHDGGTGADTMTGGTGNDYYYVDNLGDRVIEASAAGADLVFTSIDFTLPDNVERLAALAPAGTSSLTLTGNALNNEIIGNAGANTLIGNGGTDLLRGEGGDDIYIVKNRAAFGEHSGGGYDIVYFDAPVTTGVLHTGFDYSIKEPFFGDTNYIEQLSIYDPLSTNSVNLQGSRQNDVLTGNDGINVIDGDLGSDIMIGYGGNDIYCVNTGGDSVREDANDGYDTVVIGNVNSVGSISGGYTLPDNVDRLLGRGVLKGNALDNEITSFQNGTGDVLNGGDGKDLLTGNDGLDTFVFTSAPGEANADHIADFSAGFGEKIQLDHNVFTGMNLGTLSDSQFQRGTVNWQAQDADDRILYDISAGRIYFDPDGSGQQVPLLFATVHDGLILSASDFTII